MDEASSSGTIQCMGWTSCQLRDQQPIGELAGIAIKIYYSEHTEYNVSVCPGGAYLLLVRHDILLDNNRAYHYLSTHLSSITEIATEQKVEFIRNIILEYKLKSTGVITTLRERDILLPVLVFRIIYNIWMTYDEEEAVALAMEESIEAGRCKTIPAAKSAIDELEDVILMDCLDPTEECVICLETLYVGIQVRRMPCLHLFHGGCIIRWLKTSHMCPLCRFELPTERCLCSEDK